MFKFNLQNLILILLCFKLTKCDISSILFPFNTGIDKNLENKNQEDRNLSLRNRYQANSYSSSNQDFKNQYASTNLLNKLTSDKQNLNRNLNIDKSVVVPDLYCEKDEWMCHDKLRCIPKAQKCDNIQNCIDSSDELNCENKCRGDQFKCANNKCILEKYSCDGYDDCSDGSDELNCIGAGKVITKFTGDLKLDLVNFETLENQNQNLPSIEKENTFTTSQTDNHPNKNPDIFNSQKFNDQINNHYTTKQNNQSTYQINDNKQINKSNKIESTLTPLKNNQTTKLDIIANKLDSIKDNSSLNSNKLPTINNQTKLITTTLPTNYEAPYVKIFPLTPVVKNTESSNTNNNKAFNNYAILTNKLVNSSSTDSSNKSLIENLGFNVLNKSIESPKQEVQSTNKIIKLAQNKNQQDINKQNTSNSLENDKKKNSLIIDKNQSKKDQQKSNRTSIDVSKSNSSNRLAFSISMPKTTEPTILNKENRKTKSKDDGIKKLNCKKNPTITGCSHCFYGLFRCSMGKCVITSFECGKNATQTTRGRRVSVNVNDFLQFV